MSLGSAAHQAGELGHALQKFRQALAIDPTSLDALNACATLLLAQNHLKAAFDLMLPRQLAFASDADSACNWAIICEQVAQSANSQDAAMQPGKEDFTAQQRSFAAEHAARSYEVALTLDPDHLRSLCNSALLAASNQRWHMALERLQRCWQLAPEQLSIAINFADVMCAAHDNSGACRVLEQAERLPHAKQSSDLRIRQAVFLAFDAQWEASSQAMLALSEDERSALAHYLESIGISALRFGWHAKRLPPPVMLYLQQAFKAMLDCHWKGQGDLIAYVQEWTAQSHAAQQEHDWRDLQFFSLMLPLSEEAQDHASQTSRRHFVKRAGQPQLPAWREHSDGRIHVAVAAQDLADERQRCLLAGWLSRVDRQRFAIHLFAQTPAPDAQRDEVIKKLADSYTDIASLVSLDVVQRIRAMQPHIFMDTAYYTPSCRAELPFFGVAPIQVRHISWQRLNAGTAQFVIGDHFTHPDGYRASTNHHGALHAPTLRLPHSCWLHCDDTTPLTGLTRQALNLPEDALILCSRAGTPMIGPETFALWMQIMRALPHALLWLPSFERAAQVNLREQAQLAKITPERIVFALPSARTSYLAQLQCADLFLDPLLFNANHGLVEALRMGVPALSCAGHNMASRLGGSILQAAGLSDCVFDSETLGVEVARQRYLDRTIELGSNRRALNQLKSKLQSLHASAPLFNPDMHIAQWQAAWQEMADQTRQGRSNGSFQPTDIRIG
jgi:protein O-GlcNAc transferase